MGNKGFFSVMLAVLGVSMLLFSVSIQDNSFNTNYYAEFISDNEMQYLYINNLLTAHISEYFESFDSCNFGLPDFILFMGEHELEYCENFTSPGFNCNITFNSITQKAGLIVFDISINQAFCAHCNIISNTYLIQNC